MAQADNVIEVVIKAVDNLSAQVAGMKGQLDSFTVSIDKTSVSAAKSAESLSGIETASKGTNEAITGLGGAIVVVNQGAELFEKVFGGLSETLREFSRDAGRLEQDIIGLTSTMQLFGKSAPAGDIIKFTEEINKTQNVSRELALQVARELATFSDLGRGADATGEKLQKITAITIALAKVTGRSPEFSAIQIGNFLSNPNITSIGRGITAPSGLSDIQKADFLIDHFNKTVDTSIAQVDSFEGQQKRLQNSIENVGHAIGEAENVPLKNLYSSTADVVDIFGKWLGEHEGATAAFTSVTQSVIKLGEALVVLAGIKWLAALGGITDVASALSKFGPLLAFLSNPLVAIALGAGIAGKAIYDYSVATTQAKDATDAAAKATEQLAQKQALLKAVQAGPQTPGTKSHAENIQKEIDDLQKRIAAATGQGTEADESHLQQRLDELLRNAVDTARKAQAAIIGAQADVAIAAKKALFDETGNFDALLESFDLQRKKIIDTARVQLDEKLREAAEKGGFGKEVTFEQLTNIKEVPTAKVFQTFPTPLLPTPTAQLLATPQGQAIQETLTKAAQPLTEAEKAKVALGKQQAILKQQETVLKANLDLITSIATVQQSLLDNDQAQLKILQDTNAPVQNQLDLINKISAEQIDLATTRINAARQEIAGLEQIRVEHNLQGPLLTQNLASQEKQTAEIVKQQALLARNPADTNKALLDVQATATKQITTELQAQETSLQSVRDLDQRRIDLINAQAQAQGKQRAPVDELLTLAQQLDDLEAAILQKKIAQQQAEVAKVTAAQSVGLASKAELDLATAQLQALEDQASAVKTHVLDIQQQLAQEAANASEQIAGTLADNIITGLQDGLSGGKGGIKKFIDDLLISTGKALVVQGFTELIKGPVESLIKQEQASGEKTPTTIPGLLFANLKSVAGQVFRPTKPEATVTSAADTLDKEFGNQIRSASFDSSKVIQDASTGFNTAGKLLQDAATVQKTAADVFSSAVDKFSSVGSTGTVSNLPAPLSSQGTTTTLPTISTNLEDIIQNAAAKYNVDPNLIKAIIQRESSFNVNAPKGAAGEVGLMQVKPSSAAEVGVTGNLQNPEIGVDAGTAYLAKQLDRFSGNVDKAISAYNAGPNNKSLQQGNIPNQAYVDFVKQQAEAFRNQSPISPKFPTVAEIKALPGPSGSAVDESAGNVPVAAASQPALVSQPSVIPQGEQARGITSVKVAEPVETDISRISPEAVTEFAQVVKTPTTETAAVPSDESRGISPIASASQQGTSQSSAILPGIATSLNTAGETLTKAGTDLSSAAVALTKSTFSTNQNPEDNRVATANQPSSAASGTELNKQRIGESQQSTKILSTAESTAIATSGISAERAGEAVSVKVTEPVITETNITQISPEAATEFTQVSQTAPTDITTVPAIRDAAAEQIGKLAEVQNAIIDQSSKTQPTELVQVSSEAATEFTQASTNDQQKQPDTLAPAADAIVQSADASSGALTGSANSLSEAAVLLAEAAARLQLSGGGSGGGSNVHLGPSQSPEADAVNNLGDAIENLGERKPISTASTSSGNNSPSFSTAGLTDNLSFADINKTLGPLLGLAGGTAAAPFASKIGGALSAGSSVTSLFKNLQSLGLFGNSASPFLQSGGINFATSGALTGDIGAASSSGGFFSSIIDFFSSLFHEGGPIERRMHVGGLAHDEVPIIAQHGEYMLQKSAVSGIGQHMLDMINTTGKLPKFHDGGAMIDGKLFTYETDAIEKRMHTGGLAADEVPMVGQHGEYMLQKSAVAGVGKHVLDMINTTGKLPKFHNGGVMLGEKPPSGLTIPTHALASLSGANKNAENDPHIKLGSPTQQYSAGQQHVDAQPIHQNIYVVDKRPPNLSQNDVVVMVENDMIGKNGRTARAVQNVIKRTR